MQQPPIIIKPVEDEIIERSLEQSPKEIADALSKSVVEVLEILSTPEARQIRENKVAIANSDLQFKRLERAKEITDKLIDGIEQIVQLGPTMWKMHHVKLFELLMKDIPEQVKSLQQIQINNTNNFHDSQSENKIEDSLDNKMEKLPSNIKMQFWQEVETLAEDYVKKYGIKSL